MSKKRERTAPEAGVNHGPDPSSAESLLFQLASDSSTADLHQSKRVKSEHSTKNSSSIDENIAGKDVASSVPVRIAKEKHPAAVAPSSTLRHCDGLDVVRKGSRGRGRQLMILPGVLGLGKNALGGKLGTLKDITSATPVLYVDFPEVRLTFLKHASQKCTNLKSKPCAQTVERWRGRASFVDNSFAACSGLRTDAGKKHMDMYTSKPAY